MAISRRGRARSCGIRSTYVRRCRTSYLDRSITLFDRRRRRSSALRRSRARHLAVDRSAGGLRDGASDGTGASIDWPTSSSDVCGTTIGSFAIAILSPSRRSIAADSASQRVRRGHRGPSAATRKPTSPRSTSSDSVARRLDRLVAIRRYELRYGAAPPNLMDARSPSFFRTCLTIRTTAGHFATLWTRRGSGRWERTSSTTEAAMRRASTT